MNPGELIVQILLALLLTAFIVQKYFDVDIYINVDFNFRTKKDPDFVAQSIHASVRSLLKNFKILPIGSDSNSSGKGCGKGKGRRNNNYCMHG